MNDQKIIFSMSKVSKVIPPSRQILKDIHLSFFYGAKIGVIGLNGSGKSTLLKIIANKDQNYNGEVNFAPNYSVGILNQEPELDNNKTVKEIVLEGVEELTNTLREYENISEEMGKPECYENPKIFDKAMQKQMDLQNKIEAQNGWQLENTLERAMQALRCPDPELKVDKLSGGERRRIALCRLLIQEPDVLLLDEPTNHLDAESVYWLERHLKQYKGTVIAVTHDRYFLDNVAGWILELDRGEGVPWEGNYSSWLEQKMKRMELEQKQESKRQKTLQRELEWAKMTPKAKRTKSKARLSEYKKLAEEEGKQKEEKLEIYIPPGPRLGNVVIEANKITKSYNGRTLFKDFTFSLPPAGIIGVVGPNGVGKTTLFRLITGLEKPDSGEIKIGETVKIAYVDQMHADILPNKSVWEVISEGNETIALGNVEVNSRSYVGKFNFTGSDQQKKIEVLSGGERNRVHLALTLKKGANLILLDEPTNDIDINTLRALEEGIENFAGCVVVISHDRWFLDRVCTHIMSFEDDKVRFFEGSYSEYEEKKKHKETENKKFKYKKLL